MGIGLSGQALSSGACRPRMFERLVSVVALVGGNLDVSTLVIASAGTSNLVEPSGIGGTEK
ncbi:MAG: hypothetical protein RL199_1538 [Pseudomonadota bacterium]